MQDRPNQSGSDETNRRLSEGQAAEEWDAAKTLVPFLKKEFGMGIVLSAVNGTISEKFDESTRLAAQQPRRLIDGMFPKIPTRMPVKEFVYRGLVFRQPRKKVLWYGKAWEVFRRITHARDGKGQIKMDLEQT